MIWEWQSDDKSKWNKYDKEQTDNICALQIGETYSFSVGAHRYVFLKLSADAGKQSNASTKFERAARKSKIHKIDGVRYPEFWSNEGCYYHDFDKTKLYYLHSEEIPVEQDYVKPKVVQIEMRSKTARNIKEHFFSTVDRRQHKVLSVESVQNKYLWDRYHSAKKAMERMVGRNKLNERHLWWPSTADWTRNVIVQGFRKEYRTKPVHTAMEGVTVSVAANAYVGTYNEQIYCLVLCGESGVGSKNLKLTDWPLKGDGSGQLYDSMVDNKRNPSTFTIHDDTRIYPMFIVHYR